MGPTSRAREGRSARVRDFLARERLDDVNGPDERDPADPRYRLRRLAAPALLLLIGPAIAAVDQPAASPLYFGAYRFVVGAFITLIGLVALWFVFRD